MAAIEEQLVEAAQRGEVDRLTALIDAQPDRLQLRTEPYAWSLLHHAAHHGRLAAVDALLARGFDVNTRERGDNTYAMHWAAAAGTLDVVRRLADAGGDVIGQGDDHALEVIGWATCWEGGDDAAHRAVAEFLVSRGARHHIFSAMALNLADEVRRIVAADPSAINRRMSRNEEHRQPLHFAVLQRKPEMVALLLELGADPLAVDGSGQPAAIYATSPEIDRPVMERIRAMTAAELDSAARGHRPPRVGSIDLLAALALEDWATAENLLRTGGAISTGALHVMTKRNAISAVKWLLDRGLDPNARWAHWDAEVTPLHLAALAGHLEPARLLLAAGANPRIRDSKHDADAIGWANFFRRTALEELLKTHAVHQQNAGQDESQP
jgi:ankyrin repeat protein